MPQKFIAHIDLDCFFVSVERIKNPSLIGKPVVVGGSTTRRGVVASASYEARKFGVRSAMPTAQALRLYPSLIVVSGHHGDYSTYSNRLYKRMLEVAPVVERASIDEMYLDFTGCESLYSNNLPGYMKTLQEIIKTEFELPCTIALASNKLVAKIAANTVKPVGVIYVPPGTEKKFLSPLPIGVIPGVGKKTEEFLTQKGFKIIADLQDVSLKELIRLLGAHGEWIHRASNGGGSTALETEHIAKNISREETFEKDISDIEELEKILFTLTESVCSTLRLKLLKARTVQLKLRSSKFETITRRHTIKPTNYDPDIFNAVKRLLHVEHNGITPIRLIGVGLSNFTDDAQAEFDLFPSSEKQQKVLQAVDKLREKFGDDTIKIGGNA
jgi:DNA polymerase-4